MEYSIGLESPFSLDYTLESGQVFRWENKGEWWYGVLFDGVVKARQEGETLRIVSSSDSIDSSRIRFYFRLDEDLQPILASIMKDATMAATVQTFYGLRLARQNFWECLASFVLATNSNIPRIRKMVSSVCFKFGPPIHFEGLLYHAFPSPEQLADASLAELGECGLGYRAPFLKRIAESVAKGEVDGEELSMLDYEQAHRSLLKVLSGEKVLLGVGPKVADCVLLYSCSKDEAFPIDVWIARALSSWYPGLLAKPTLRKLSAEKKGKLTLGDYRAISSAVRAYFGRYAGYAQQYLYMMARDQKQTTRPE